jgi:ribitol-5-phosphate 2-dehydrogenase
MINKIIRLVSPRKFQVFTLNQDINNSEVIVRPTYMSICAADQRYYNGSRPREILNSKLPMALIHEAIGEVVYSYREPQITGSTVVMIPNIVSSHVKSECICCTSPMIGENYCRHSKFKSSGLDGFMQELVVLPYECILELDPGIPREISVLIEPMSVVLHALNRLQFLSHSRRLNFGVWGDGFFGYLTSLLIKHQFRDSNIYVFGKHPDKMQLFSFVDGAYQIDEADLGVEIDHAFECVGGMGSVEAINQIIKTINPGGSISLLGVSENLIQIDTRLVLEKGLSIIGNSRSSRLDFVEAIRFLVENNSIMKYLQVLISNEITVRTIDDIIYAFDTDKANYFGKTLIKWNI